MTIEAETLHAIDEVSAAGKVLAHIVNHDLFREEIKKSGKAGGYICKTDHAGRPLLILPLGALVTRRWNNYFSFTQEKCTRLAAHPQHLSSMKSRDPNRQQYGGAVRGVRALRAISGLTEEQDELFSVLWSIQVQDMDAEVARTILERNTEFHRYRLAPQGLMK